MKIMEPDRGCKVMLGVECFLFSFLKKTENKNVKKLKNIFSEIFKK